MDNSSTVLYDYRVSLPFRIIGLAFGLFALWIGAAIAAYGLFHANLGFPMVNVHGFPLLGSLACFGIGAIWIFIWFGHLRILFDASRRDLIVWTRGYLRRHERRVALADAREFHVQQIHCGPFSQKWRVSVDFADGRTEHLADILIGEDSLAESLRAATKLPVIKHESMAFYAR